MKKLIVFTLLFLSTLWNLSSATKPTWIASPEYPKAFIENLNQFNGRNKIQGSSILYAIDHGPFQVYFTKGGLTYRLDKKLPRKKWDKTKPINSEGDWVRIMEMRKSVEMITDIIHVVWEGSNPDVIVTASDQTTDYFSYSMGNNNINYNFARGYKKLVYKNLYKNIDLQYEFHPEKGFKYAFILHPGADPSVIRMKYSGDASMNLDASGNLKIDTQFGPVTDHAPLTFYDTSKENVINSSFILDNNTVTFSLNNYNKSQKVIIDPWTVFPVSPNSNKVWEVETDNTGNVYTYAGDMPITLRKYNSAGALQWTYLTAWDSAGFWVGGMITHPTGDCYITSGSNGQIRKITPAGSQQWFNNPNALTSYEYWSLAFNCDLTRLVVGGTRVQFSIPTPILRGTVMEINLNNGALVQTVVVGYGNVLGLPPDIQEVSSICSASNGNYYFLTLDTVGAIKDDLSAVMFKTSQTYNFDYYIPGYGFGTKQPISAIRATHSFFYTMDGATLDKRDLNTGAIVQTTSIPGGINNGTFFGTRVNGNGGLDVDSCGNVYVGSGNAVHKFDSNLNLLASASTPGPVYDVDVSPAGEVAASGSNFVASVALSPCNVPTPVCITTLTATASSTNINCSGQCTGSATAAPLGGTPPYSYQWSNGGTTPTISNLCAGSYTVVITDGAALVDSTSVTITEPLPLNISTTAINATCGSSNGSATTSVAGGTGSVTYNWSPTGGTGAVATNLSAGIYTVIATDANGCTISDTVTVSSIGGPTVMVDSVGAVSCFGGNNGFATVSVSSGTSPYTYSWNTTPVQTSPTATGLPAGSYTITVTDSSGCIESQTITVGQPLPLTAIATVTGNDLCDMGNGTATATAGGGTPGYTFLWNTTPPQSSASASGLTAGIYIVIVTDANNCTVADTIAVSSAPSPQVSLQNQTNVSCAGQTNGSVTISVTSGTLPFTYVWSTSPPQTTATASGLAAGTYSVTVTDANNCTANFSITITSPDPLAVITSSTPSSCGNNNGTVTATVSGGTPNYSYSWNTNPVQSSATATGLFPGSYAVTITDANGCTINQTATVIDQPAFVATATGSSACTDNTGMVSVTTSGGTPPYSYQWNPTGGTASSATGLGAGTYSCLITDANGCTGTVSASVIIYPPVVADAGTDITIESGTSTQLTATGGTQYNWSPAQGLSCTDCQSPVATPDATTTYCVLVTDANGCTGSDCTTITIDVACGELFVPNAFSPDGSNHPENEKLCVYHKCIKTMEFSIFTRWGEKVFTSDSQSECWDGTYKGKALNTGIYVYFLNATLIDGTKVERKGDISLIR